MMIIVLILLAVLVEATLIPLPLPFLILILWLTRLTHFKGLAFKIYAMTALGGGLLDILTLRPYGITTAIFLFTVFVIRRYSLKVETYRLRYLLPVTILAIGTYSYFFYSSWTTQVFTSLLVTLIFSLIYRKPGSKYDTLVS